MNEIVNKPSQELQALQSTKMDFFDAPNELIRDTIGSEEALALLINNVKADLAKGVSDAVRKDILEGYKKEFTRMRNLVDKRRKEIAKPAADWVRGFKKFSDKFIDDLKKVEAKLTAAITKYNEEHVNKKDSLRESRTTELMNLGYTMSGGFLFYGPHSVMMKSLAVMSDEVYQQYLNHPASVSHVAPIKNEGVEEAQIVVEKAQQPGVSMGRSQKNPFDAIGKAKTFPHIDPLKETEKIRQESHHADAAKYAAGLPISQKQEFVQAIEEGRQAISVMKEAGLKQEGFDNFRAQLIALVSDTDRKLTRQNLIEWAKTVEMSK